MFDIFTHKWLRVPYTLYVRENRRPKKPIGTVLFIHGIGNSGIAWNEVVTKLPKDIRVVTIDLLGFGDSPSPKWAVYNAKTQANSVIATLFKLRMAGPVVVVGHSLGSLVAIEVAKRYPLFVKALILCSPPLYKASRSERKLLPHTDSVLKDIYKSVQKHPEQFVRLSAIAMKYNLVNRAFNVTQDNVASYMAALEASIINQTSIRDAKKLKVPTRIIRGTLDPSVINRNLKEVALSNKHVTITNVIASHEVKGLFVTAVVKAITGTFRLN